VAGRGADQLVTGGNMMVLGLPASVMLLTISRAGALAEALRAISGVIGRGWKVCPAWKGPCVMIAAVGRKPS
jgi:hypothetical protein